jgi:hypothetical protein
MDFPMPIDEKLLTMQGLDDMPTMDYFSSFASPQLSSKKEQHKETFYNRNNKHFEDKLGLSARSTFDMLQQIENVEQQVEDENDALVEPKALGDNLSTSQKVAIGLIIAVIVVFFLVKLYYYYQDYPIEQSIKQLDRAIASMQQQGFNQM